MPSDDSVREPAKFRTLRFFPFVFLGFAFIGGHGWLPLVISLIASLVLTAGVSFLIGRGRQRRLEDRQP